MTDLIWASNRRATFGILVKDGMVVETAPYLRRQLAGRSFEVIGPWLEERGFELRLVI